MAPKGYKRPAAAEEEKPSKIAKKAAHSRMGYIVRALSGSNVQRGWSARAEGAFHAEGEVFLGVSDGTVFEMLGKVAPGALGPEAKDRDDYQKQMVEMIGKALEVENKLLKDAVTHAEAANQAAQEKQTANEAQTNALQESLSAKTNEVTQKSEKHAADKAAEGPLKTALDEALAAQKSFADGVAKSTDKKAKYVAVRDEALIPLKDGPAEGAPPIHGIQKNKLVRMIVKTFEDLEADEALVAGIPISFKAASDKRGPYDAVLIDFASKTLATEIGKCEAEIAASASGTQEKAAAVNAATATLDAAKAETASSEAAVKAAEEEEEGLQKSLKESKAEVKHILHDITEAAKDHEKKVKVLSHFEDVYTMYKDQKEYVVPEDPAPVEEEEEAPPAPVEAAPAEAVPAPFAAM